MTSHQRKQIIDFLAEMDAMRWECCDETDFIKLAKEGLKGLNSYTDEELVEELEYHEEMFDDDDGMARLLYEIRADKTIHQILGVDK